MVAQEARQAVSPSLAIVQRPEQTLPTLAEISEYLQANLPDREIPTPDEELQRAIELCKDQDFAFFADFDQTQLDCLSAYVFFFNCLQHILLQADLSEATYLTGVELGKKGGSRYFESFFQGKVDFVELHRVLQASYALNVNMNPLDPEEHTAQMKFWERCADQYIGILTTRPYTPETYHATYDSAVDHYSELSQKTAESLKNTPIIMRDEKQHSEAETNKYKIEKCEQVILATGKPLGLIDDNASLREPVKAWNEKHPQTPIVLIIYPGYLTKEEDIFEEPEHFIFVSDWQGMGDKVEEVKNMLKLLHKNH